MSDYTLSKISANTNGLNTWACFCFVMLALIAYDIDRIADRYDREPNDQKVEQIER